MLISNMKTYKNIKPLVKINIQARSKYPKTVMVVCKVLSTLASTLKDKSVKNTYSYNILLMDTQYKKMEIVTSTT